VRLVCSSNGKDEDTKKIAILNREKVKRNANGPPLYTFGKKDVIQFVYRVCVEKTP